VSTDTPISYLMNPQAPESKFHLAHMQAAARDVVQQFVILSASSEREIDAAFAALARQRSGALIVSTDPFLVSRFHQIVVLAAYHKIPTIYDRPEFVAVGGLISYGRHLSEAFTQIGVYAGKIIKGTRSSICHVD
jgi:putative tryptophan/tyrosine transport system substrate-binding protein